MLKILPRPTDDTDALLFLADLGELLEARLIAVHQDVDDTIEPRFYVTPRGKAAIDRHDESAC